MAVQDWKTTSVRLTPEERNALELLRQRKNMRKTHALLRQIILREIDPILNPTALPQGEGLPQVGDPLFKYNPDTDTFLWQLDQGTRGLAVLSENVEPLFAKKLKEALEHALAAREEAIAGLPTGKARVPKDILRYKVK